MSFDDDDLTPGVIIGVVIGLIVTYFAVALTTHRWTADAHAHKVEAVRHGAAEWRTDEHGQVSFHWKTNPVKP